MKCLGNNSYLSELFLAGNCNFHCKTLARSPSHVARQLSNVSTVRPRFPMLRINQILGPHSVQSETTLWWRTLVWPLGLEPYSALARLQTSLISFAWQMSFSQLVFDDTAATPVDKPFHAVFPMDVAQVQVVICDEVVKNLFLYLKSTSSSTIWQVSQRFFSLNISRLGSGTSACPWKNAEYSAYHQDNDSQQASKLTGRKQILLHSAKQPF